MYTEIIPDYLKTTLGGIIQGRIDSIAMVNSDVWSGYDGLVDVGFDRHYRVQYGNNELMQGATYINDVESF